MALLTVEELEIGWADLLVQLLAAVTAAEMAETTVSPRVGTWDA
jgi:hypothetical protein